MKPIYVFYHFFIPDDLRATSWSWCLDEQMKLIKQSGLDKVAKVKMCINMPMLWNALMDMPFTKSKEVTVPISFAEKVQEYIHDRYPFIQIVSIRDNARPNIYEGLTLHELHKIALKEDANILYFNNKGAVSNSSSVGCWRQILNHFCITEWEKRIKELEENDVVGLADAKTENFTMSGNFWWSKSEYIRKLPQPLNTEYLSETNFHMFGPSYRYAFEKWIMIGEDAKIHYAFDTKTDHYKECLFLEDIK